MCSHIIHYANKNAQYQQSVFISAYCAESGNGNRQLGFKTKNSLLMPPSPKSPSATVSLDTLAATSYPYLCSWKHKIYSILTIHEKYVYSLHECSVIKFHTCEDETLKILTE